MMNSRPFRLRLIAFCLAVLLIAVTHRAHAGATPEGMKGWWYFTGLNAAEPEYVADPITACKKAAARHMGTPLLGMRPGKGNSGTVMECKYEHSVGSPDGGGWYGMTMLSCENGYFARSPGVCVKRDEAPAPAPSPGGCQAVAQAVAVLSFGDGSIFAFYPRSGGTYSSRYDKRMSLKALSAEYDDWLLTTSDGRVERYKKIDGAF